VKDRAVIEETAESGGVVGVEPEQVIVSELIDGDREYEPGHRGRRLLSPERRHREHCQKKMRFIKSFIMAAGYYELFIEHDSRVNARVQKGK